MSGRSRGRVPAIASVLGLVAGLALGLIAFHSRNPALLAAASAIEPLGTLWVDALRMIVLPLIVSHLFLAIVAAPSGKRAGAAGALSLTGFVGLLVLAALFTLTIAPPLIRGIDIDAAARAAFQFTAGIDPAAVPTAAEDLGFADFLTGLIPDNPVQAAADGAILPVLLFTAVFALATRAIPPEQRNAAIRLFQAVASASRVIVGWLLIVLPAGVFAIALALTAQTGFEAAGVVGSFVLLVSGTLVAFTLVLYPLVALVGRVSIRRFARGVAPSQLVAASTRSSLATLPALVEGARDRIGLDQTASAVVLPLAVSTFKVNRTVSSPIKLLLLAHVYGLTVEPGFILVFLATVILLSFSSPGIPGGGAMVTTPVYLAAGIPLQGILLLEAADAVNDVFKTVANVTADMAVATMVARWLGRQPAASVVASGEAEAALVEGAAAVS